MVHHLEELDRAYFAKDRHKQIKAKIEDISGLLDTRPIEFSKLAFCLIEL